MWMKCRECGNTFSSKEVRDSKKLTYVSPDEYGWHDCIDGSGSRRVDEKLDNLNLTVKGYCGCLGWP